MFVSKVSSRKEFMTDERLGGEFLLITKRARTAIRRHCSICHSSLLSITRSKNVFLY